MSGKVSLFSEIKEKCSGSITLGDKDKCKILGISKVCKDPSKVIHNVYLVEGLKFNLQSVSQLCDKGNQVIFDKEKCVVKNPNTGDTFITALRYDNVYTLNTNEIAAQNFKCLKAIMDDPKLWCRRLGHINTHTMHELISKDLVKRLPALHYNHSPSCDTCIRGKQLRSSFKLKKMVSTSRPCELLHIDLYGPMRVRSIRGKSYILVIVDDYSRCMWVNFLKDKGEALKPFPRRCKET